MSMINVAKLPVTAAAAMVAVVGIALLSPSSSPSATPTQPIDRANGPHHGSSLTVTENGVRFSFEVRGWATPTKWDDWAKFSSIPTNKSPGGFISLNKSSGGSQGAEGIIYWTSFPNGDYADPCARLLGRSVGRSAAALATAVATAPRTKLVKGPSDVTLGGHPAKFVWLKVRKQVGCEPGFFYKWEDEQGGELWPRTPAGSTIRVWIVDVDGTRLFIAAMTSEQATLRLKNEIYWIVQSIRFN
jgi:hypothetical protein